MVGRAMVRDLADRIERLEILTNPAIRTSDNAVRSGGSSLLVPTVIATAVSCGSPRSARIRLISVWYATTSWRS